MSELFISITPDVTEPLAEAKLVASGKTAYGMAMAPSVFRMFMIDESGAVHWPDNVALTDNIFQYVIFNEHFEFQAERQGGTFLVTVKSETTKVGEKISFAEIIENTSYVWGNVKSHSNGFAAMYSSRVGTIFVPVDGAKEGDNLVLTSREYIAREPENGNAYIAADRLTGITIVKAKG